MSVLVVKSYPALFLSSISQNIYAFESIEIIEAEIILCFGDRVPAGIYSIYVLVVLVVVLVVEGLKCRDYSHQGS